MTGRSIFLTFLAGCGLAAMLIGPRNADAVFASPVNGGCYLAASGQCRLHIDPVTVNVASGERLVLIRVQVNGVAVYDYRTDISNPPPSAGTTYQFSPVGLDFGATCGKSYVINVLAQDTGDANPLNVGETGQFTCPDKKALKAIP